MSANVPREQDLIAYKVLSLDPFSIEESSPGTGAACASIYLDQGFQALLRKKLGLPPIPVPCAIPPTLKPFTPVPRCPLLPPVLLSFASPSVTVLCVLLSFGSPNVTVLWVPQRHCPFAWANVS